MLAASRKKRSESISQRVNHRKKQQRKIKTKARVEHVFGFMEQYIWIGIWKRGIVGSICITGLINLTYNIISYEQIVRLNTKNVNAI